MYDTVRASAEAAAELSYVMPLAYFGECTEMARTKASECGRLGEWWNWYWKAMALGRRGKIRRNIYELH